MNVHLIRAALVAAWLVGGLAACDDSASGGDDDGGASEAVPIVIALTARNNYAYESALHIPTVETAPGADIEICWGGLTRDFQCHEMDPKSDIENAALVRIRNMSEPEIEAALGRDGLAQANIDGYIGLETNGSADCVHLSDFSFLGSEVAVDEEYVVSGDRKYLLVLTTGTTPGIGARMMTFMRPTEGETNRSVSVADGCEVLDFSASLTSLTPVPIPAGGRTVLDWSDLAPPGITRVMLGYYENKTPVELEARVIDLMLIATEKWELAVAGSGSAALDRLVDDTGAPFTGFGGHGTWIFALLCEQCQNPAPSFLTVLDPGGGADR